MKDAGQQPGGEISVVGLIEEPAPGVGLEVRPIPLPRTGCSSKAFAGEGGETEEDEGGIIRRLVGGDGEVVSKAERVGGDSAGDGAEIGHEAENAFRLLMLQRHGVAVGVAIDLGCGFRGLRLGRRGLILPRSGGGRDEDVRRRIRKGRAG